MQENTDLFKKLNNHRLPIDESYWAEMEKRLLNNRRKRIPLWIGLAGTGVAASLAFLLTVPIFNADNGNVSTQMTQIEQISADNIENEQIVETQITQIFADNTFQKNPRKSVQSVSSACQKIQEIQEIQAIENKDVAVHNNIPVEQDTISEKQYELKPIYNNVLLTQNEPQKRKVPNKKSWQIAAAFSSGAPNFSGNNLTFSKENLAYSSETKKDNLGVRSSGYAYGENELPSFEEVFQQFPEVIHLPPLSFGLTIRKNLNKYIAIETGLTYSFLQSKFKDNNEWTPREATLKLHYLGIPLNGVAYLLNKPKWNVYFSLGGMVEKGVMLDYVQHTSYNLENSPIYTTSLQDDIPELQWSLNTSFGVSYKLYRDFSIYFEPRIVYYFKNNQPVSARTEMPLLVGLNAGLRFEF